MIQEYLEEVRWLESDAQASLGLSYNEGEATNFVWNTQEYSGHGQGQRSDIQELGRTESLAGMHLCQELQYTAEHIDDIHLDNIGPAIPPSNFSTELPFRRGDSTGPVARLDEARGSRTSTSSGALSSVANQSDIGGETPEPRHNCTECLKSYKLKKSLR